MSSDRISGYSDAILAVARAEGNLEVTRSQLTDVARAVEGDDRLRAALSNNLMPATNRVQIVDDILGGKATDVTRALVGMIVVAGRGGDLTAIVDGFVHAAAASTGHRVAVVRSAVALTEEQRIRLGQALSANAGGPVELQNVVDPEVIGGAVTTIGDTVIDGSIRTRLNQMKDAL